MAKVIWLTGLSASGKTTLARAIRARYGHVMLDGDEIRSGVSRDLDLSAAGQTENIRRIACIARLLKDQGMDVVVSCISRALSDRRLSRRIIGSGYTEIYLQCPFQIRKTRDKKGVYDNPSCLNDYQGGTSDLTLDTDRWDIEECMKTIEEYLGKTSDHENYL